MTSLRDDAVSAPPAPGRRVPDLRTQRTAAGGGLVLMLRFAATAVLNYGFGVALAWLLPRSEFGAVSVLQNVLLLAAAVLSAGLPWALARTTAQTDGLAGSTADEHFRTALVANLGLGAALAAGFVTVQFTPLRLLDGAPGVLVAVVALTILLFSLNAVLIGALRGGRRFDAVAAMQTFEVAAKVGLGLAVVGLLGLGVSGVALGFLIGAAGATWWGWRGLRDRLPGRGPLAGRASVRPAVPIGIAVTSLAVLATLDVLALGTVGRAYGISGAVVGMYQAAAILGRAAFFLADALGEAVFPFIARGRTRAEAHGWFVAAFRWVLLVLVPVQLVLLIDPATVLGLVFPGEYAEAAGLVRLVAFGALGLLIADMLLKALCAGGMARSAARRAPVGVAVEVAALIVLVPPLGARGAAIAFAAGSWVTALLLAAAYLGHHRPVRLPARPAAGYAAAIGVLCLGLAAAAASPSLGWLVLGAALGGYALVAVRTRLIREDEVARLRAVLRRLAPRLPGRSPVAGRGLLVMVCSLVAGVAVLWNLPASPDTQYDEIAYTLAAQSVAQDWRLTWTNAVVFVHPPLSFLAQAGWLELLGRGAAPIAEAITATRLLAGLVTVLDLLLIGWLAYRLMPAAGARRRAVLTMAVVVLAATDPTLLRYGRLALIEPFALLGSLVTLHLALALWRRRAALFVLAVGLATGLTLLCKEMSIFLLLTPLVYAALSRDRRGAVRAAGALAAGTALWLVFPLWAVQLGQSGSFLDEKLLLFERMIGVVQLTGWNQSGVSFLPVLVAQLGQFAGSYLMLLGGGLALVWLLLHRLPDHARWLLAWLLTSYAFGTYTVLLGTLNEHFFFYVLPAAVVATVLAADAVVARRAVPVAAVLVSAALLAVAGLSVVTWTRFYVPDNDGLLRAAAYARAEVPACSAVNASGDPDKYAYLMPGYTVTSFATGPGALSHGVHLFFLSDKDAAQRIGNATPELTSWVRANGDRLASFRSATYRGVELWHVPGDPHDPLADVEPVAGGSFVTTDGSRCGGLPVVDGPSGDFATAWVASGGKAVAGPPITAGWRAGGTGHQIFAGVVLAAADGTTARAAPVVPLLRERAPDAYRRALLPPLSGPARRLSEDQVEARLTDRAITAAYLGTTAAGAPPSAIARARERFGDPAGPVTRMPDGQVRQAFTGVVLERPADSDAVRLSPIGPLVIEAGIVAPPVQATRPVGPPPFPPPALGPRQPATAEPFLYSLGAALAGYAVLGALVLRRRRRDAGAAS